LEAAGVLKTQKERFKFYIRGAWKKGSGLSFTVFTGLFEARGETGTFKGGEFRSEI
jgi:hypothetical protein